MNVNLGFVRYIMEQQFSQFTFFLSRFGRVEKKCAQRRERKKGEFGGFCK